jgi:hypothetical protein
MVKYNNSDFLYYFLVAVFSITNRFLKPWFLLHNKPQQDNASSHSNEDMMEARNSDSQIVRGS